MPKPRKPKAKRNSDGISRDYVIRQRRDYLETLDRLRINPAHQDDIKATNRSANRRMLRVLPTNLYRFFDKTGQLLYVGISISAVRRMAQHKKGHWFHRACRTEWQTFPDRAGAEAAEKEAIRRERPLFNVTHNSRVPLVGTFLAHAKALRVYG